MKKLTITLPLLLAVAVLGWTVGRVVTALRALLGGPTKEKEQPKLLFVEG